MYVYTIILIISFQGLLITANIPVETFLNTSERILYHNYTSETHSVTTEDGYILTLFRIPGKKSCKQTIGSVLLMHAFLTCSSDWLYAGPRKGLAYLLADECYDVWLGNRRGNRYSRRHTILNPDTDNAKFYHFTLHESGYYDVPAMIDYISNITEKDSIFYVGHSQGTTDFFIMASERPEYNQKIKLAVALGPVAYVSHVKSPVANLIRKGHYVVDFLAKYFDIHEIFSYNKFFVNFLVQLTKQNSPTQNLALIITFLIIGFDFEQVDRFHLPSYLSETPSPSSFNILRHLIQLATQDEFIQYDYGLEGNLKKYGKIIPPIYNLNKITAPVFIQYANNDWLDAIVDVQRIINNLPNVESKLISYKNFNHLDYIWAKDIVKLVNADVIKTIKKYSQLTKKT